MIWTILDLSGLSLSEMSTSLQGFGSGSGSGSARIRMFLPCPDPGKKVRKWKNKSLFCRVGDVQCKQFHFFCSDFKHPLLRIIWNVKKTKKKFIFSFYPQPPPPDTPRIRIRNRIRIRKKKMRIRYPGFLYAFSFVSNIKLPLQTCPLCCRRIWKDLNSKIMYINNYL